MEQTLSGNFDVGLHCLSIYPMDESEHPTVYHLCEKMVGWLIDS